MHKEDLDRAFGPTPPRFSQAVSSTLAGLKESTPRRLPGRSILLVTALLLLVSGIVYAALQLGHEWYYQTQANLYKEYHPENYQAIMDNLVQDVPQEATGPATTLTELKVQEYAWVDQQGIASFSLLGRIKNPAAAELYSLWEMDLDGAQVGVIDPEDPDSRLLHYLRTPKGWGPPLAVMQDPAKQLLLLDLDQPLTIGDSRHSLVPTRGHIFTTDEGPVMRMIEINLKEQSGAALAAIREYTDQEGNLRLHLPFAVVPFADNTYGEPIPGELVFTIQITK